jgi:hypothetical protein
MLVLKELVYVVTTAFWIKRDYHLSAFKWEDNVCFRWVVDDWGPCSVTCAGGSRFRHVHCAEEGNGTRSKVSCAHIEERRS